MLKQFTNLVKTFANYTLVFEEGDQPGDGKQVQKINMSPSLRGFVECLNDDLNKGYEKNCYI